MRNHFTIENDLENKLEIPGSLFVAGLSRILNHCIHQRVTNVRR
jgi:hypothetical protein